MKLAERPKQKFSIGNPVHFYGSWRKVLEYWWDFEAQQWVCVISSDGSGDCLALYDYSLWRIQETGRPPKPKVRH